MERELSILNGGEIVAMNGFVKSIFLNTLLGMLGSLHEVDVDREIRVLISAKEPSTSRPDVSADRS